MASEEFLHQQTSQAPCFHPSDPWAEFPRAALDRSVVARFEEMVALYPDRLAVKSVTYTLSYAELNTMANRIAHALLSRRGSGEEPIALLLNNDAPMIAAMLAVLKAGKGFVPLDPSFPQARLTYLAEDAQATLIVTDQANVGLTLAFARHDRPMLALHELAATVIATNPGLTISPDRLACIFYTSGSTGQPKGVFTDHRSLLHYLLTSAAQIGVTPEDRFVCARSFSFNGALKDIFGALLNGAAVYPFQPKEHGFPAFIRWIKEHRLTIYTSVATLFRQLTDSLAPDEQLPSLRMLLVGAEPLRPQDLERYRRHCARHCRLSTSLGTTETGMIACINFQQEVQLDGAIVPAGYPAQDKEILILDPHRQPLPAGEVGEIAVRSAYLALGYWRRPDLTAERFLPDPEGGARRIYLTGDYGYLRSDGCLFCVGREDAQVKIRGNRVELAEIEGALMTYPAIKEAVVNTQQVTLEGQADMPRLVAYLVSTGGETPTVSALHRFLAQRLPDYMIPAVFVMVENLPVTQHGKLDRHNLPKPSLARPTLDTPFAPPRTSVEITLVALWQELLGVAQVGIYDHFLDLGGNSLLATQIMTRVQNIFQIELALPTLFGAPTIAALALMITQFQAQQMDSFLVEQLLDGLETLPEESVAGLR